MATTFLEPGGDANFTATTGGATFWTGGGSGAQIATDFVHGTHIKSLKFVDASFNAVTTGAVLSDAGTRISFYIYLVTLPTANSNIIRLDGTSEGVIRLTPTGILRLVSNGTQIGSDGATLSTGVWYRICLAYKVTSNTVNRFELFVNSVSSISVTNATLGSTGGTNMSIGAGGGDATLDFRTSDHYVDNSNSLTDTGDIWVTAKRPVSNGTTNGFTTQIGAGGSGYGTGHSPQVNERPLSTTNGWSMVGAGAAITEEYNIEGKSVGDLSVGTVVDWLGWASMSSLASETVNIIIGGSSVAQAITSTITLYTKIKGSSTYPAGTGTDIGIQTDTSLTTVSLYECGILVAYTPASAVVAKSKTNFLSLMGCGT